MAVEALVFGGDDGVLQIGRHRLGGDQPGILLAAPGEGIAVAVEQRDRALGAAVDHRGDRRHRRGVVEHRPGDEKREHAGADESKAQAEPQHPADQAQRQGQDQRQPPPGSARRAPTAPALGPGAAFRGGLRRRLLLRRRIAPVRHEARGAWNLCLLIECCPTCSVLATLPTRGCEDEGSRAATRSAHFFGACFLSIRPADLRKFRQVACFAGGGPAPIPCSRPGDRRLVAPSQPCGRWPAQAKGEHT